MLLLLVSCTAVNMVKFDSGARFNVEIAKTPDEKANGLMFRKSLSKDSGMLFVFDDEQPRSFWMKNTLIPLDMIFLDSDLVVVDIQTASPCKEDPCRLYRSPPAMYVLEINNGMSEKNKIKVGSKMFM